MAKMTLAAGSGRRPTHDEPLGGLAALDHYELFRCPHRPNAARRRRVRLNRRRCPPVPSPAGAANDPVAAGRHQCRSGDRMGGAPAAVANADLPCSPPPLVEFLVFGLKQAWACLFGGLMVGLIIATRARLSRRRPARPLRFRCSSPRSSIQAGMLAFRLETLDEAKMILVYHVVGTAMEVFKTAAGSWIYPEEALFRIGGVPLFSGFMYAAIGSYIARCFRLFDFRFIDYPPAWAPAALAVAIYVNFFAHHFLFDIRDRAVHRRGGRLWPHRCALSGSSASATRCRWSIGFRAGRAVHLDRREHRHLDPHLGLPQPADGWQMVSLGKLGSWYLLMIVSFVLVTLVNRPRPLEPRR